METQRSKADINFSLNVNPSVFNTMNDDEKNKLAGNYLQQIQNVLLGAVVAGAPYLDLIIKINLDVLPHIQLSGDLLKILQTKQMVISVVFVGTGEGRIFA